MKTDTEPPEPMNRSEQRAEAYRIASNAARLAVETLLLVNVTDWTREEKDGVLLYLDDIATLLRQRANGCGRF